MGGNIADSYLPAMWYAVLRGQEPYMGSVKEQENQERNDKQKERESLGKSLKVARFCFGADEAVVADIPKRVGVMILRAKGFTRSSSFVV